MKAIKTTLCHALLAGLAWPASQAMASTTFCNLAPLAGAQQKVYVRDMGTLYVARDAVLGTVIGTPDLMQNTTDRNNLTLDCEAYGDRINFDFRPTHGIAMPMPLANRHSASGPLIKTNVPGISVMVKLDYPFKGSASEWIPIGSNPPYIPFTAYHDKVGLSGPKLLGLRNLVTLVKTGDLAPGIHYVDGQLFTGHLDWAGMGQVVDFTLKAMVVQSQCSLVGDPVSANPVQLGEWSVDDFTHAGFTTPAVPFHIRLSNCQVDPGNQSHATLELEGIDGSAPIGPPGAHVFSLTHDSEARGLGIQMLYNGNPMPLNLEVPLQPLQDGDMTLNFQARFYQVEPSTAVRAGNAKGALNFTLRYR
ncbi:type 1 fimbrial protein [Pseudomonas xanthosomatis]|uniref:fimbrial protein n=1 Tax=Pseudomonas xanthosomatis TaxID=2842356 RepID=UPI001C3C2E42|nr:fimbrial protein [Pseudomonas xanthosomatis]QXH48403.1 type 1 fimbrial protein [Pseudomonas xanthosomatis]